MARIILVRHGPSAFVHAGGLVDRDGVERWREAYDAAGIRPVAQPPAALRPTAADADHIVASDMRRALESAEVLAPGRPIRASNTLREIPLAIPHWRARLPLEVWGVFMYFGWRYRVMRGTEPSGAQRARVLAAAELLQDLVADGSTALVVTHGAFRVLLAQELVASGWAHAGRIGGYRNWSSWMFSTPGTPGGADA